MEPLMNYNTRAYNFTVIFFRIILAMVITMVLLVIILRINETVSINQGEIVSANPQADYKAPFESNVVKVYVKEGQQVKAGDTLLQLNNNELAEQQFKYSAEIDFLTRKIESLNVLDIAVRKKKLAIDQTNQISANKYQLDINRIAKDMRSIDEQYASQKERLSTAKERYAGDSILFKKDMLSKYELNNTRDANAIIKENVSAIASLRNRQLSEKNIAYNDFTKEQNNLLLTRIQLEENNQALIQAKTEFETKLVQAREALKKINLEIKKQNIISDSTGIVNFLYNTRQASNVIAKGELLVSVAPKTYSFYAKVTVAEKDVPYLTAGLDARLKLDAFQKYRFGPLSGKLFYVAERKENQNFYALIALDKNEFPLKSGYAVRGEIIIDRLPLYKYFIKKLFKQIDNV